MTPGARRARGRSRSTLDLLDATLLPNARNAALRSLFTETRPVVAMHLDHAKRLMHAMRMAQR